MSNLYKKSDEMLGTWLVKCLDKDKNPIEPSSDSRHLILTVITEPTEEDVIKLTKQARELHNAPGISLFNFFTERVVMSYDK